MPGQVLRQLGYVQGIPASIHRPVKAVRSWASKFYRVVFATVLLGVSFQMHTSFLYSNTGPPLMMPQYVMTGTWSGITTIPTHACLTMMHQFPQLCHQDQTVNILETMYRSCITLLPEAEEEAANEQSRLDKFLEDWHSAN
ncbi:hypothetical protein IHE45_03G029200 [Dioscorea alata]|uniref:Uncharacterized protein n=3 Tax=Dioscorea alata TaxID=55571 RepID=A0ACB7WJ97_DIOAL|nr:hypothetical protein IHE45_03G029200 [Dioscorea alata]KAH7688374.1 hypothetical protein IHE45_03G029200 [Dioscorea alata]KAH7688375.1 hypothetical protein IHE45_03G029200 [Dioscorea alata]